MRFVEKASGEKNCWCNIQRAKREHKHRLSRGRNFLPAYTACLFKEYVQARSHSCSFGGPMRPGTRRGNSSPRASSRGEGKHIAMKSEQARLSRQNHLPRLHDVARFKTIEVDAAGQSRRREQNPMLTCVQVALDQSRDLLPEKIEHRERCERRPRQRKANLGGGIEGIGIVLIERDVEREGSPLFHAGRVFRCAQRNSSALPARAVCGCSLERGGIQRYCSGSCCRRSPIESCGIDQMRVCIHAAVGSGITHAVRECRKRSGNRGGCAHARRCVEVDNAIAAVVRDRDAIRLHWLIGRGKPDHHKSAACSAVARGGATSAAAGCAGVAPGVRVACKRRRCGHQQRQHDSFHDFILSAGEMRYPTQRNVCQLNRIKHIEFNETRLPLRISTTKDGKTAFCGSQN